MSDPDNGSSWKSIWRLVIPICILAVVIGTTLGQVWHRHTNTSAETCPICHLSHQVVEPAVAVVSGDLLIKDEPGPEPLAADSISYLVTPQVPARAPPA
ncbi:MAG TPA: hypothetical protein VGF88_21390 [Acidobacteriaceae bacterium]|jgi:hypothetical protein